MAEEIDPGKLEIADELIAERRSAAPGQLPDDMPSWHAKVISAIDLLNGFVGRLASWLLLPLCAAMVYEVVVRKLGVDPTLYLSEIWRMIKTPEAETLISPKPTLWAYDVSRMLYGAMFMLGAAYGLSRGVHIRADFIYRNWSDRAQASVDLLLYLLLFFPGMIMLLYHSSEFAFTAWQRSEKAMDTAWMPHLGPIKSVLPISVALLVLQGVSEVLKCWYAVRKGRWPV